MAFTWQLPNSAINRYMLTLLTITETGVAPSVHHVCRVLRLPIEVTERWTGGDVSPLQEPVALVTYCQDYNAALIRLPATWVDYVTTHSISATTCDYAVHDIDDPNDPGLFMFVNLSKECRKAMALLCGLQKAVKEELPGSRWGNT